ncbi:hypothetical protein [Lacibacter sediminis]|uniref:DUF1772 domain-containing protein n=1 Tax=Lacibacter sediminis TaxID=2760713 RepID=A0A7G5XHX3_9BACT|nr:hypothetical protein [Lacibacter sediminis]QNA45076.1 hypothetical protein H4075_02440 [Lacibacter sediminis]
MELKILVFLNLLIYSVIVSQSFMYMIALRNVQESMGAASYIEIRKLLDKNFLKKFKPVVYSALVLGLALVAAASFQSSAIIKIGSALAFAGLIADVVMILKGDMPINRIINSWTLETFPANWVEYRSKWLYWFSWRQFANISGFIALLIAAVFG